MMDEDITSLDTEELRAFVEETEEQYDRVASFVRDATVDHGEMTYRKMLSSRSKARWELDGFHGFDLEFRSGMDGMYSRDMEIHKDGEPVVHLHYPVKGEDVEVELYDEEAYDAFAELAAEPDAAFEAYEREQERIARMQDMMRERRRRHRERERERERLLDEVERLDLE